MSERPLPTAADLPALPAGVSPVVCQLHRWLGLALTAAAEGGWDEAAVAAWWESVAALLELLAERHGTQLESARGNYRLYSFDRAWRIEVAAQDRIDFSPQIEVARTLFRQWLAEADASPEVKAIVARAWDLDETGRFRVQEIVRLANYRVEHPTWQAAMAAVREAMFVIGSREYLRVHRRNDGGGYDLVTLDFASAPRKLDGATALAHG